MLLWINIMVMLFIQALTVDNVTKLWHYIQKSQVRYNSLKIKYSKRYQCLQNLVKQYFENKTKREEMRNANSIIKKYQNIFGSPSAINDFWGSETRPRGRKKLKKYPRHSIFTQQEIFGFPSLASVQDIQTHIYIEFSDSSSTEVQNN